MKRFLAFKFDQYYPSGGANDILGDFDSKEEAWTAIGTLEILTYGQVLDMETLSVTTKGLVVDKATVSTIEEKDTAPWVTKRC